MYSIDELCKVFHDQAQGFEEHLRRWHESNPDAPAHMAPGFNLPRALHVIASEIKKLREHHESNKPQIPTDLPNEKSENPQGTVF